ncbi:MAG: hypothetical protein IKM44_04460, partial [Clostridia bacterium]|nr:hypothetical protein [Clostridia bacterium]
MSVLKSQKSFSPMNEKNKYKRDKSIEVVIKKKSLKELFFFYKIQPNFSVITKSIIPSERTPNPVILSERTPNPVILSERTPNPVILSERTPNP